MIEKETVVGEKEIVDNLARMGVEELTEFQKNGFIAPSDPPVVDFCFQV